MFELDDVVRLVQTGEEELAKVNEMVNDVASQLENIEPSTAPTKYYIFDLFWLVNPKILNDKLEKNEAALAVLSFNAQFGNLRVSLHRGNQDMVDLEKGVIYLKKAERVVSIAIYPEQLARIVEKDGKEDGFVVLDRVVGDTNLEWISRKREAAKVQMKDRSLRLSQEGIFYNFANLQYFLFLHCCKWVLNHGFALTGRLMLR